MGSLAQATVALLVLLILAVAWASLEINSLRRQLQPILESGVARAISAL